MKGPNSGLEGPLAEPVLVELALMRETDIRRRDSRASVQARLTAAAARLRGEDLADVRPLRMKEKIDMGGRSLWCTAYPRETCPTGTGDVPALRIPSNSAAV